MAEAFGISGVADGGSSAGKGDGSERFDSADSSLSWAVGEGLRSPNIADCCDSSTVAFSPEQHRIAIIATLTTRVNHRNATVSFIVYLLG
jgi:hypothetical protein